LWAFNLNGISNKCHLGFISREIFNSEDYCIMPLTWIHNFGKAVCKATFACEDMLRLKQIQNPDVNTVYLQTNCRITPVFHTRIILWKTGRNCKHHAILSKIRKTLIEPRFAIQIWLLQILPVNRALQVKVLCFGKPHTDRRIFLDKFYLLVCTVR
jgi:hypothetical protein